MRNSSVTDVTALWQADIGAKRAKHLALLHFSAALYALTPLSIDLDECVQAFDVAFKKAGAGAAHMDKVLDAAATMLDAENAFKAASAACDAALDELIVASDACQIAAARFVPDETAVAIAAE
jgi:hypothetical protein